MSSIFDILAKLRDGSILKRVGKTLRGVDPATELFAVEDATTNGVTRPLDLTHTTTGTPAAGIGVGLRLRVPSTTKVTRDAGAIDAIHTTATNAAEVSTLIVRAGIAGTLYEVCRFTAVASAVNGVEATASATGQPVMLSARGSDTNVGLTLRGKGTGGVTAQAVDGTYNGVSRPFTVSHIQTGLAAGAAGIGAGVALAYPNDAGGAGEVAAAIDAVSTTATDNAEDDKLVFSTRVAGALTAQATLGHTGGLALRGGLGLAGNAPAQMALTAAPTGGSVVDVEARAFIAALRTFLIARGDMASS